MMTWFAWYYDNALFIFCLFTDPFEFDLLETLIILIDFILRLVWMRFDLKYLAFAAAIGFYIDWTSLIDTNLAIYFM